MALIPYPDLDTLAPELRASIEHFSHDHGRPTLLRQMLGWSPPAMDGQEHLYHPVMENGVLPRALKEALFVAASNARDCAYCMGGHSRFLVNEFGYGTEQVIAMREGGASDAWSERELALIGFVRGASAAPDSLEHDDVARLEELGWTMPEIVEAVAMACQAGWTNTIAQALHLEWDIDTPAFEGYF